MSLLEFEEKNFERKKLSHLHQERLTFLSQKPKVFAGQENKTPRPNFMI